MKNVCVISLKDDSKIFLHLNNSDYHAKKLEYVLSRSLDRSVYSGAKVIKIEDVAASIINMFDKVEVIP